MKKTHKTLLVIFFGLVLLTSLVVNATADDDDDDIPDDFEEQNSRSVSFDIESDRIVFESISKQTDGTQDEIDFRVELSDDVKIRISYYNIAGSEESELEFEIYIDRIFEFVDDGDGVFYEVNDTIIQEYQLEDFTYPEHTELVNGVGSKVHYVNTTTGDGVFSLHLYISEEFEQIQQSTLSPTQLKIDFEIDNFPYLQSDTMLSLRVEMESEEDEYEHDEETEDEEEGFDDDEDSYTFSTNNFTGFFSWKEYAIIDGIQENVSVSTITELDGEELEYYLYFTYSNGMNIYHDPSLGIAGILKILDEPYSYLWIIIVSSIAVVVLSSFGILMSKSEYRDYIVNRVLHINKGAHTLDVEEVFNNEMRNKVLDLIIDEPGIHYNELFRKSETSASNLAWHLDILETYKIIKKARVGNYLVFYPFIDKNPFAEFNHNIVKSKTTLEIFGIIADNPGIHSSKIAHRMEIDHKTVKYHVDKLRDVDLVFLKKEGRKILLYSNIPKDDFLFDVPE
ncbi:MAG: hypothetical protein EU530_02240 [Promethearchaeota archaeon]|nr:MAG: hypothetical protein EU530_02240 [Candidatus Lokiarchaeota archaeon]